MNGIVQIKYGKVREIIKNLNQMDLDQADFDHIKKQIGYLMTGLQMKMVTPHKDSRLYRGVIYKEKPTKTNFLGYPPATLITDFQRCNSPGNSMFYCSVDPSAVYYELGVRPGDKVYVSKWSVLQDFFLNRIAPRDEDETDDLVGGVVLTFFETKFSQPIHETYSSQYKITSAISEKMTSGKLMDEHRILGGLTYPSVTHPNRSENVAIRAAVVDQFLHLDYVEEILIADVQGKNISYTCTDFSSKFDGGNIVWTGKPLHWTMAPGAMLTVKAESDGWVARDENGNIVNPG